MGHLRKGGFLMLKKVAVIVMVMLSLMAMTVHAKDADSLASGGVEMPVIHSQF